ncbi:MAG TPA: thioredoxin [Burkholderiales bacterium]
MKSPHIADVSRTDFAARVIEQSHKVPVLVDFWAPWCGPCRMLTPVLERLAEEYAGRFFLAKVNTDVEQELALQFHIRGIPAVKLFRNGRVVGEFVGVQPEPVVRDLIERFLPTEADIAVERADALAGAGRRTEALALLREAVAKEAANDRAKLALARLLLEEADERKEALDESERVLESLSIRAAGEAEVDNVRLRLSLHRIAAEAPPRAALEQAVAADPGDVRARYRLAARLALAGEYEPAMQQLLEIVRRDRKFEDDAGRKTLVGLFRLLGNQNPLVTRYRTLLSSALA